MVAIPASLAVVASLLLGSPVTGALTFFQVGELMGMGAQQVPQAIALAQFLRTEMESPAFRAWAAANGEIAIRLRPGIATQR